jgi:hypothetical protein
VEVPGAGIGYRLGFDVVEAVVEVDVEVAADVDVVMVVIVGESVVELDVLAS